ncbi:MAG: HipA domain-containing protein [Treponema sp.]|nr:HipA domain-containing protein [Treponema sp.]
MKGFSFQVQIEINGTFVNAGRLLGNDFSDSVFIYDSDYISSSEHCPVSISLPFQDKAFSVQATRNYFEGLLPEGFSRQCIASSIHADTEDYISILRVLGSECLGAIRILDEDSPIKTFEYKKLTDDEIKSLAAEGATKAMDLVVQSHLSLTGASGKIGLFYDEKTNEWFLPIGLAPSNYIVKQSHVRLKNLVLNEQLCLTTARKLGIDVPESFVFECGNKKTDDSVLFASKRFDRFTDSLSMQVNGHTVPYRLHQEDFAQAMGIKSSSKYELSGEGYLKKMFDILKNHSSNPIEDQLKLWKITIFNYLIGNTDNHIKNTSLIYSKDLKSIRLAPCYDIVSTKIYDSGTEEMSLSINGKLNHSEITPFDFETEAQHLGLGQKLAMKIFSEMTETFNDALSSASRELKEKGFQEAENLADRIMDYDFS